MKESAQQIEAKQHEEEVPGIVKQKDCEQGEEVVEIAQQIDDEHGNVEEERMTEDEVALEELFGEEVMALGDIEEITKAKDYQKSKR